MEGYREGYTCGLLCPEGGRYLGTEGDTGTGGQVSGHRVSRQRTTSRGYLLDLDLWVVLIDDGDPTLVGKRSFQTWGPNHPPPGGFKQGGIYERESGYHRKSQ